MIARITCWWFCCVTANLTWCVAHGQHDARLIVVTLVGYAFPRIMNIVAPRDMSR
jgi:hypothetical protein